EKRDILYHQDKLGELAGACNLFGKGRPVLVGREILWHDKGTLMLHILADIFLIFFIDAAKNFDAAVKFQVGVLLLELSHFLFGYHPAYGGKFLRWRFDGCFRG